jgi:hypothetical protein
VIASSGKSVDLRAVFETHRNTAAARRSDQLFDAIAVAASGDDDAVEGASGFEGFADGMDAGQFRHGLDL